MSEEKKPKKEEVLKESGKKHSDEKVKEKDDEKHSGKKADSKSHKSEAKKKVDEVVSKKKKSVVEKIEKKDKKKVVEKKFKKKLNFWKIAFWVLLIVVIFLGVSIGVRYYSGVYDKAFEDEVNDRVNKLNGNSSVVEGNLSVKFEMVVIEDSSCEECQVDYFIDGIKENLLDDLEVKRVEADSEAGKQVLDSLGVKFAPVFIFSKNIEQAATWSSLEPYVFPIDLGGVSFYLLNPNVVLAKILTEEIEVLPSAVVLGNKDAEVTIYEFTDFECPVCALVKGEENLSSLVLKQDPTFVAPMPKIYEEYVETGKVKYVFYNFPIDRIHKNARLAHNAGMCANEQSKFKKFSDKLFLDRSEWVEINGLVKDVFLGFAEDLKLDGKRFEKCLDSLKYDDQINSEIEAALPYGLAGTPTFFVNKNVLIGLKSYDEFKSVIDKELEKVSK